MRKLEEYIELVEGRLSHLMAVRDCPQKTVYESMQYSVAAGGKRLRPVLCLAACEASGGKAEDVLNIASAIEMIHTFSLIHDDLPCMDDDDFRRGKPTNHKIFGEDIAVLAGDGLIIYAFEAAVSEKISPDRLVRVVSALSRYSGKDGMIGGQIVDLQSENKEISAETLEFLHKNKTSALICMSLECGCLAAGGDEEMLKAFREYGTYLGLAFQVQDDILDVVGDSEVLGKPAGSDSENGKSTYVTMFGLERAKQIAEDYTNRAINAVKDINGGEFFVKFAEMLMKREK